MAVEEFGKAKEDWFTEPLHTNGSETDKVNLCGEGYTPVDGICLNQEVANYIGCVRPQGVELNEDKRKNLTAELGYLGAKVSGEGEFSDQLNKKYMASDKVMLEIIKRCDKIAGIHIPNTEAAFNGMPKRCRSLSSKSGDSPIVTGVCR